MGRRGPKPGDAGYTPPAPLLDRIRANVVITDSGCWEWQGNRDGKGYARGTIGSRLDGTYRPGARLARALCEELHGPLGELVPDHTCFNPPCVNPAHLEVVTRLENARRRSPDRKPRGPNLVRYQAICVFCRAPYVAKRRDRKFCSPKCRMDAFRAKRA